MASTVRALLSVQAGGPATLQMGELAAPVAAEGEVVIQVAACGINFPDSLIIEDRYQFKPARPFAPGGEIAGAVIATAPGVLSPKVGDRVISMCLSGGLAEQVAVPARSCVPMPDSMSYEEGAAFIMTYGTSYHALVQRGRIARGETLLVLGAAGGVGLAAVQLGKVLGATVVAAVSDQAKLDIALAHGAHRGFVYPKEEIDARALAALMKEHCGPRGADVVFDPVGGAFSEAAVRTLAWNGRFVVIGFAAGIPKLPLNLLLLKGAAAIGVFYGAFVEKEPATNDGNNRALISLYDEGAIAPLVSQRFDLGRGGEAIRQLAQRQATGKLIVDVSDLR